jgi:hypothetical protein
MVEYSKASKKNSRRQIEIIDPMRDNLYIEISNSWSVRNIATSAELSANNNANNASKNIANVLGLYFNHLREREIAINTSTDTQARAIISVTTISNVRIIYIPT